MSIKRLTAQTLRNGQRVDLLSRKINATQVLQQESNRLLDQFVEVLPKLTQQTTDVVTFSDERKAFTQNYQQYLEDFKQITDEQLSILDSVEHQLKNLSELKDHYQLTLEHHDDDLEDLNSRIDRLQRVFTAIKLTLTGSDETSLSYRLSKLVEAQNQYMSLVTANQEHTLALIEKIQTTMDAIILMAQNIDSETIVVNSEIQSIKDHCQVISQRINNVRFIPSVDSITNQLMDNAKSLTPEMLSELESILNEPTDNLIYDHPIGPQPYDETTSLLPIQPKADEEETNEVDLDDESPGFLRRLFGGK